MAETDIEVEGPDGSVFAFPAGTTDGVMRTALLKHYQKPEATFGGVDAPAAGVPGDASAAIGRGLVNGIPILGPYLMSGLEKGAASVRAIQNDTTYSDELKKAQAFSENTAKANPWSTTAGELGGGVLGTIPAVAAAPAAFGIGSAALPLRMAASAASGAGIGATDAAVRSGGNLEEAKWGGLVGGGVGAVSPPAGILFGKLVAAIKGGDAPGMAGLREALSGLSEADLASAQYLRESSASLPGGGFGLSVGEAVNKATGGRAPRLSQLERVVGQSGGNGANVVADAYAARPAAIDNAVRSSFDMFGPVNTSPTGLGFDVQAAARAGLLQTPEGQAFVGAREAVGPRVTPLQSGEAIQTEMRALRDQLEGARAAQARPDYDAAAAAPERAGIDRTTTVERPGEPIVTYPNAPPRFSPDAPAPLMSAPPVTPEVSGARPQSFMQWLARNGGVPMDADTLGQDFNRIYVPGNGTLARRNAPTWDQIRVRLMEEGYRPADWAATARETDVRDFVMDQVRRERFKQGPTLRAGDEAASVANRRGQDTDEFREALSSTERLFDDALDNAGVRPGSLRPEVRSRALGAMMDDQRLDPLDAYERVVGSMDEPMRPFVKSTTVTEEIPAPRFGQASPLRAIEVIDNLIATSKGNVLSTLRATRRDLFENAPDPQSGLREPEMAVRGLHQARERLDQRIAKAIKDEDGVMASRLQPAREAIDQSLKEVPEMAVADARFEAASRPLDPLTGNTPLGRVTARDDLSGRMQTPAEQVPGMVSGPTAARELLAQPAPAARQALEGRIVTQIIDQAERGGDVSANALRAAMREHEDVLAQLPGARGRLSDLAVAREGMTRVEASPLGQIAQEPSVKRATDALFAREPAPGSQNEVASAMRALGENNRRAADELSRHYLESVFNQATREMRGQPAQYGGAAFASAVRGGPQQRQNLEAVIRSMPDGEVKWKGMERLLTVLEATGYRPIKGSDTAFNAAIQREMEAGTPLRKALVDVTTGGAAGATVGGVAGGVGGAAIGLRRALGDAYTRARVMGQGEVYARLLFDPKALPDLRALAKAPAGSKNAELFTQRLLTLANSGTAAARD